MTSTIQVVKMGIYDFWQGSLCPWLLWTWPATVAKDQQVARSVIPSSKSMTFLHLPQSVSEPGHPLEDRIWDVLEHSLCARYYCIPVSVLIHLILLTTLWSWYYYFHCACKETKVYRGHRDRKGGQVILCLFWILYSCWSCSNNCVSSWVNKNQLVKY